jgi:MarR family transcriptional regulator, organic hydroperoxide resistance regulator
MANNPKSTRQMTRRAPEAQSEEGPDISPPDVPPLGGGYGLLIMHAYRVFARAIQDALLQHGVSHAQYHVLRELWLHDGQTQVELSLKIKVERAAINSLVSGMTRMKLISQRRNRADRRKVNIFLTERGRALKDALQACVTEVNEKAGAGLSPKELADFHSAIETMVANLTHWDSQMRRRAGRSEPGYGRSAETEAPVKSS